MSSLLINALTLWLLLGGGNSLLPPITNAQIVKAEYVKNVNLWIEKLSIVESGNNASIRILDSNQKYSTGCLQFQDATFLTYVRRYKMLPSAEDDEVMNYLYDCDFQKLLGTMMILENFNNWQHWFNSTNKIGYPPKNPFNDQIKKEKT